MFVTRTIVRQNVVMKPLFSYSKQSFSLFRATGEIVRAAVRDFESLSLDGKLQVEVLNTGYVTSSFYVSCIDIIILTMLA